MKRGFVAIQLRNEYNSVVSLLVIKVGLAQ
jgi:hypothetical protein